MVAHVHPVPRAPVALQLELSPGRHGAAARFEWHDRAGSRVAWVRLQGRIGDSAASRLAVALDDLAACGASRLLLDCSELSHIDYRLVPALVGALDRFESRAGAFVVCGLSRYLRDLFRLAGCEPRLRCWPSAEELLECGPGPAGERAS